MKIYKSDFFKMWLGAAVALGLSFVLGSTNLPPMPPHSPTPDQWLAGGGDPTLCGFPVDFDYSAYTNPPTPAEMGLVAPIVPDYVPEIVSQASESLSRVAIRFQERETLSGEWLDTAVVYTMAETGFYRVVIERGGNDY